MPPKVRIQKDTITKAAYELVKEQGVAAFNARALAAKAGCSTQPIFSAYKSMDEVLDDVRELARMDVRTGLETTRKADNPLLGIGETYVRYAGEEPELFRLLYGSSGTNEIYEMMVSDGVVSSVAQDAGISRAYARDLCRSFFFYCHGMAASRTGQFMEDVPEDGELKNLLKNFYKSYRKLYRKKADE